MDSRLTAKLFHTIVVLGVGLTAAGCGDDDTGKTTQGQGASSSGSVASNTDGGGASSGTPTGSSTSSTSGSSTSGWFCCG